MWRAFEQLNERADELATLMTLEMGKPLAESKAEITYAAEFFRWFSGEALRIDGYYKTAGNGASRVLVMRQPIGPCYFITPWNFPNAMGTRKIGPAIAAGCPIVLDDFGKKTDPVSRERRANQVKFAEQVLGDEEPGGHLRILGPMPDGRRAQLWCGTHIPISQPALGGVGMQSQTGPMQPSACHAA